MNESLKIDTTRSHSVMTMSQQTVLALYTPDNDTHTRSVLLCPIVDTRDYALIDNLSFVIAFTISSQADADALRRFMIRSYDFKYCGADEIVHPFNNKTGTSISQSSLSYLNAITTQNALDYDAYQQSFFVRSRMSGEDAGSDEHDDEAEACAEEEEEMYNVAFIRDWQEVSLSGKAFAGERQFCVTVDNHLIVAHFVNRFRYTIEVNKIGYEVRLLDPVSRRSLWPTGRDVAPEQYVEKQICALYNKALLFPCDSGATELLRDGLLWGATLPPQKMEQRLAYGEAVTLGDCVTVLGEQRGKYRLCVRYLTHFIRVMNLLEGARRVFLVDYTERKYQLWSLPVQTNTVAKVNKTQPGSANEERKAREEEKRHKNTRRLDTYFPVASEPLSMVTDLQPPPPPVLNKEPSPGKKKRTNTIEAYFGRDAKRPKIDV